MNERQLLAIMSTIIFAGADNNETAPGYSPKQAVNVARAILWTVDKGPDPFPVANPEEQTR